MFEGEWSSLNAAETLDAAAECHATEHRGALGKLLAAVHFADLNHPDATAHQPRRPGGERGIVLGGPGCPPVREFAAAAFGPMIGISAGAGAVFIGHALALRHRMPMTWARVVAEKATPWKAIQIAKACEGLSEQAAADVDRRFAKIIDTVTPDRLEKIVTAAIWRADPAAAEEKAEENARERGVYVSRSSKHGSKTIWVRAATGDVLRFDASIANLADALKILGDTSSLQRRRAKAIGIIADHTYAAAVLAEANRRHTTTPEPATSAPQPADTADTTEPAGPAEPADAATGADPAEPTDTAASTHAPTHAGTAEQADTAEPTDDRGSTDAPQAAGTTEQTGRAEPVHTAGPTSAPEPADLAEPVDTTQSAHSPKSAGATDAPPAVSYTH
jgi:hypothetical protein